MSKRYIVGSSRSRKKRKGSSYASVDLDLPDEHHDKVEMIRVWDVTASKSTGRLSGTRKTHRHVNKGVSKPSRKETTPVVEDVGGPADYEPSEHPPAKPVPKRRRKKATKENDSVSNEQIPSSEPIVICWQTKMTDWLSYVSIMLDELLRRDGLGDSTVPELCVKCMTQAGEYRCGDCFGSGMCCSGCMVSTHRRLPLHRLQVRHDLLSFVHTT